MGCCKSIHLSELEEMLKEHKVLLISKTNCPACVAIKDIFNRMEVDYYSFELDQYDPSKVVGEEVIRRTGYQRVPVVFVRGHLIGGLCQIRKLWYRGELWDVTGTKRPCSTRRKAWEFNT